MNDTPSRIVGYCRILWDCYPLIAQPLAPYMVLVHHIFMTLQYTLSKHYKNYFDIINMFFYYVIRGTKYSESKRSFIIALTTHHTVHSPNFHIIFLFFSFFHRIWGFHFTDLFMVVVKNDLTRYEFVSIVGSIAKVPIVVLVTYLFSSHACQSLPTMHWIPHH